MAGESQGKDVVALGTAHGQKAADKLVKAADQPAVRKSLKADKKAPPPAPRSVADIQADIESTRDNLVQTVSQLQVAVKEAVSPKRIISVQVTKVKNFYVDEYGGIRPERVAGTVGVVVSIVVVRRVGRRIFGKKKD